MPRIAHLADIHIQDTRREEYAKIFEKLYISLRENTPDIIVIAGDIFETKTKITANNIKDVLDFFHKLIKIAPVIAIPGNHDTNCNIPNSLDLITPIIEYSAELVPPKFIYIRNTGFCGEYFGINWYSVAPDDTKIPALIVDNSTNIDHNKINICLFHNEIGGCKLPNNIIITKSPFTIEGFSHFDLTICGHIHLRQYLGANKRIAYSGSLIQQDMGESHEGHGYIMWNIKSKTDITPINIDIINDFGGFQTIELDIINGQPIIKTENLLTKPIRWRLICGKDCDPEIKRNVIFNLHTRYGMPPFSIKNKKHSHLIKYNNDEFPESLDPANIPTMTNDFCVTSLQNGSKKIELHISYIRDLFGENSPEIELKNEVSKNVENMNDFVEKLTNLHEQYFKEHVTKVSHGKIRLIRLEFDNLFCYGENNVIDFTTLEYTISGVSAANFMGKSSLIDILLFALYEKYDRADNKSDIILKSKLNLSDMFRVFLVFELNGKLGYISKVGDGTKHYQYDFVYDNVNMTTPSMPDTCKIIQNYIGEYCNALTTCVMTQNNKGNLLDMSVNDRKRTVVELVGLGALSDIESKVGAKLIELTGSKKVLRNVKTKSSIEILQREQLKLWEECKKRSEYVKQLGESISNLLADQSIYKSKIAELPLLNTSVDKQDTNTQDTNTQNSNKQNIKIDRYFTYSINADKLPEFEPDMKFIETDSAIDDVQEIVLTKINPSKTYRYLFSQYNSINELYTNFKNFDINFMKELEYKLSTLSQYINTTNIETTSSHTSKKNTRQLQSENDEYRSKKQVLMLQSSECSNQYTVYSTMIKGLNEQIEQLQSQITESVPNRDDLLVYTSAKSSIDDLKKTIILHSSNAKILEDRARKYCDIDNEFFRIDDISSIGNSIKISDAVIALFQQIKLTPKYDKNFTFGEININTFPEFLSHVVNYRLTQLTDQINMTVIYSIDLDDKMYKNIEEHRKTYNSLLEKLYNLIPSLKDFVTSQPEQRSKLKFNSIQKTKDAPIITRMNELIAILYTVRYKKYFKNAIKISDDCESCKQNMTLFNEEVKDYLPEIKSLCVSVFERLTYFNSIEYSMISKTAHLLEIVEYKKLCIKLQSTLKKIKDAEQSLDESIQIVNDYETNRNNDLLNNKIMQSKEQIAIHESECTLLSTKLEFINSEILSIDKNISENEISIQDKIARDKTKALAEEYEFLNNKYKLLEEDYEMYKKYLEEITPILGQIKYYNNVIANIYHQNDSLTKNQMLEYKAKLDSIQSELQSLYETQKDAIIDELNAVNQYKQNDILLQNDLDNISKLSSIDENVYLYTVYRKIININSSYSICNYLLRLAKSDLTENFNATLKDTGAVFSIEIDNDFNFYFVEGVKKMTIGMASGYQKFAINLALRLSLWKITDLPLIDCLIIDEGFTACDEQNLASMSQFLSMLSHSRDMPRIMFIVSHLEQIKNKIQQQLQIVRKEDVSYINNLENNRNASTAVDYQQEFAKICTRSNKFIRIMKSQSLTQAMHARQKEMISNFHELETKPDEDEHFVLLEGSKEFRCNVCGNNYSKTNPEAHKGTKIHQANLKKWKSKSTK